MYDRLTLYWQSETEQQNQIRDVRARMQDMDVQFQIGKKHVPLRNINKTFFMICESCGCPFSALPSVLLFQVIGSRAIFFLFERYFKRLDLSFQEVNNACPREIHF